MSENKLSHIDEKGAVRMVDVSAKAVTARVAAAEARVWLPEPVLKLMKDGDIHAPKGPVFQTARIAGIQGAKRTGELIPLCHPIGLDGLDIHFTLENEQVVIRTEARVTARTGVEMEALTAASIAALTVYDMCKAVSHDIEIKSIRLIEKRGGKNDFSRS